MTRIGALSVQACCWAACATCTSVGSTVGTADGGTTGDSGAAGVAEVGSGAPPAGGAPTGACGVAEPVGLAIFLAGFGACLMTTRWVRCAAFLPGLGFSVGRVGFACDRLGFWTPRAKAVP